MYLHSSKLFSLAIQVSCFFFHNNSEIKLNLCKNEYKNVSLSPFILRSKAGINLLLVYKPNFVSFREYRNIRTKHGNPFLSKHCFNSFVEDEYLQLVIF